MAGANKLEVRYVIRSSCSARIDVVYFHVFDVPSFSPYGTDDVSKNVELASCTSYHLLAF
jgi:hypothetical protein